MDIKIEKASGNDVTLVVTPQANQTITIDRNIKGDTGNGIANVSIYYDGTTYYLDFLYTDGSSELVPLPATAAGVTSFNTRVGAVTLTSTDVTTSLGYTPPTPTGTGASGTWAISVSGNSATVTNGVYTTGTYSNPLWITALAASKITGTLTNSQLANSSITINGSPINLGGSVTTPQGTITSVTATSPVTSTGGATPVIAMPAATTSANGYLTSTDWNTFNSKGSGTVTGVTGTAPIVSSGGTTPAISIGQATTSTNGYLSSTDWNTFNNKLSTQVYPSAGIPNSTGSAWGTSYGVTGTGNVVLSDAPSLTGAVKIGGTTDTTALTLGQSTDNQSIYIGNGALSSTAKTSTINISSPLTPSIGVSQVNIQTTGGYTSANCQIGTGGGNYSLNIYSNMTVSSGSVFIDSTSAGLNLNTGGLSNTFIGFGGAGFTTTLSDDAVNVTNTLNVQGTLYSQGTLNLQSFSSANNVIATGQTTGTLTIGGTSATGTLQIGQSTSSQAINIGGAGAASGTITIGRGTTAGAQTVQIGGTGNIITVGAASGIQPITIGRSGTALAVVNINTGSSSGKTTNIATNASTGTNTVSIGSTVGGQNVINIATGTNNQTLNIANGAVVGTKTIDIGGGSSSVVTNLSLATTSLGSANVSIGGSTDNTINIANSGGVSNNQAITIGSTTGSSTTTVNGLLKLQTYTVANLPTGSAGAHSFVTNALSPTFGAAVVGGGAVGVPVYHDGTSWKVG